MFVRRSYNLKIVPLFKKNTIIYLNCVRTLRKWSECVWKLIEQSVEFLNALNASVVERTHYSLIHYSSKTPFQRILADKRHRSQNFIITLETQSMNCTINVLSYLSYKYLQYILFQVKSISRVIFIDKFKNFRTVLNTHISILSFTWVSQMELEILVDRLINKVRFKETFTENLYFASYNSVTGFLIFVIRFGLNYKRQKF